MNPRFPTTCSWLLGLALVTFAPSAARAEGVWARLHGREGEAAQLHRDAAYRALEERQAANATRAALEAIRVAPRSAVAHLLLGHARSLSADDVGAVEAYGKALDLDPDVLENVRDASWVARAAVNAEHFELAIHALRVLTTRLPRIPARTVAFSKLGDALQALGPARLDEAVAAYRHALLDARHFLPTACVGLALALSRAGHPDEARGWIERALDVSGIEEILSNTAAPPVERRAREALIAATRGDRAEASRIFREVAERSPYREHALREAAR